jgi:hypothetical protein
MNTIEKRDPPGEYASIVKVVLNLTPEAAALVDDLMKQLNLRSRPEVFRRALTVLRIHVDADKEGRDVVLVNRKDDRDRQLVSAKYIGG